MCVGLTGGPQGDAGGAGQQVTVGEQQVGGDEQWVGGYESGTSGEQGRGNRTSLGNQGGGGPVLLL